MEDAMLRSLNHHIEEKDGIASYKSLSIAYGWSSEESQSNLEKYMRQRAEVKPVFHISGLQCMNNDQWSYVVRLTTSNDLALDKELKESKRHVYSIHKNGTTNVEALACFDKSLDQDPVSHPSLVSFPWKYIPPSSSTSAKMTKIASPKSSPLKPLQKAEPTTQKSSVSTVLAAAPRKSVKRPPPKSRVQSSLKFEPKKVKPDEPSEKPEDIPDPFADSDEDVYEEEAKLIQNKRRRLVFSSDEEGEDMEKSAVESKTESKSDNGAAKIEIGSPPKQVSKVSSKAPKANHRSPQKEKPPRKSASKKKELVSDDEEAIKLSPAKGVKEKTSKRVTSMKEKKKSASKVKDSDEEMIELAPTQGVKEARSPSPRCRASTTRKRLVTKTFMGDDGFLITEKVWEEVDEYELKAEEREPPKPEPAVETKNVPSPVKNIANSKPKKAKQATLMSFFNK